MVKYIELLEAASDKYLPMFNNFFSIINQYMDDYEFSQLKANVIKQIDMNRLKYKRADVIEFSLKVYRMDLIQHELRKNKIKELENLYNQYFSKFPITPIIDNYFTIEILLEHYISMIDNEPYKSYRLNNKTVEQFRDDLNAMDISTRNERNKISNLDNAEIIIDFKDSYAWFDLHKPTCDIEAQAMGHCGNKGNPHSNDTILSLRHKNDDGSWTPHLTFILNTKTKSLGEMKGKANSKPNAKYHPYIIELLKSDYVEGITGGGYKPQNNFSLSDLPKDTQDELIALKPKLLNLYELYTQINGKINDSFMEKFNETINEPELYMEKVDGKYYLVNKEILFGRSLLRNIPLKDETPVWNKFKQPFTSLNNLYLYDEYLKSNNPLPDKLKNYAEYKNPQNTKDFGYRKTISIILRDEYDDITSIVKDYFSRNYKSFLLKHTEDDRGKLKAYAEEFVDIYGDAIECFKQYDIENLKSNKNIIKDDLTNIIQSKLTINITMKDVAKFMHNVFNCDEVVKFLNDKTKWD